jgi:nitroreductase
MKNLARKLLPNNSKMLLRQWIASIDQSLAKCFTSNLQANAAWFYRLFSSAFSREQIAALAGRNAYRVKNGMGEVSSPRLRRNIHRIEKGLCMPNRRTVFALDYLNETVVCFAACVKNPSQCLEELSWAHQVLTTYFELVIEEGLIAECKNVFYAASAQYMQNKLKLTSGLADVSELSTAKVPYPRHELAMSSLGSEQFKALCVQRRSVRWFTTESVSDELINSAIDIAALAPSACNRQPFSFYVANTPKLAQKIAQLAGGTAGFVDNIPCTIVVVGDLSAYPSERDRHVIYIDAALAAMQLMLGLETLGLSSCPINWPDLDVPEQKMVQYLSLKPYQRPVMLIAVGYAKPTGMIPYSQKKTAAVLRKDIIL